MYVVREDVGLAETMCADNCVLYIVVGMSVMAWLKSLY